MDRQRSQRELEAREKLAEELKAAFDDFVVDYKYWATLRHGKPYISYAVLADMIRAGWRRSAKAVEETKPSKS